MSKTVNSIKVSRKCDRCKEIITEDDKQLLKVYLKSTLSGVSKKRISLNHHVTCYAQAVLEYLDDQRVKEGIDIPSRESLLDNVETVFGDSDTGQNTKNDGEDPSDTTAKGEEDNASSPQGESDSDESLEKDPKD